MATKYVITFSNQTEHGIESPEKLFNQTVIEHVTSILSRAAKNEGYDLDNCAAYPVQGKSEQNFRLEYIADVSLAAMRGFALWIKQDYKQESILLEIYKSGEYKAELIFDLDNIIEL